MAKRPYVPNYPTVITEYGCVDTLLDVCIVLSEKRNIELYTIVKTQEEEIQTLRKALFWSKYTLDRITEAIWKFQKYFSCTTPEAPISNVIELLSLFGLSYQHQDDSDYDHPDFLNPGRIWLQSFWHGFIEDNNYECYRASPRDCHLVSEQTDDGNIDTVGIGKKLWAAQVGKGSELEKLEIFCRYAFDFEFTSEKKRISRMSLDGIMEFIKESKTDQLAKMDMTDWYFRLTARDYLGYDITNAHTAKGKGRDVWFTKPNPHWIHAVPDTTNNNDRSDSSDDNDDSKNSESIPSLVDNNNIESIHLT